MVVLVGIVVASERALLLTGFGDLPYVALNVLQAKDDSDAIWQCCPTIFAITFAFRSLSAQLGMFFL